MTYSSHASVRRAPQRMPAPPRSHTMLWLAAGGSALTAVGAAVYLMWPTWTFERSADPSRLPVTIGNTLFNVPTAAVRFRLQKRTGPQERVDLAFVFPSLEPPGKPARVTADSIEEQVQPIDRIFLSITAHRDAMSPDERARTIYMRYLDSAPVRGSDGLASRAFRDNTPYSSEDLVEAPSPWLVARCSRDAATPGMCLSERRIEGADLTFRFPRAWLSQWRDVAQAMEQLITRMRQRAG